MALSKICGDRQLSHHSFEGKRIKLSVFEMEGEITTASSVINTASRGKALNIIFRKSNE